MAFPGLVLRWLRRAARSLVGVARPDWRSRGEREALDEIRSHLELSAEARRASGVPPPDAELEARRRFGRASEVLEQCREQRRLVWLENFAADFRFGARQLRRSPGFATIAVLMLALGIGANTAVFSVVRAVLLRPPGYEGEDRLMWLQVVDTRSGVVSGSLSWREMEDIRESARSVERVGTFSATGGVPWRTPTGVEELTALQVTADLIEALRITPVLGRPIRPSDLVPGAEPVVMLSHRLWRSRFGGSPDALGASMALHGTVHIVVGVLPGSIPRRTGTGTSTSSACATRCWERANRGLSCSPSALPGCSLSAA